ncbi:MAG: methyltransferase domain-containing protein [Solirubrobacteraceae bacterium]
MSVLVDPQREREELQAYLGSTYEEERLRTYAAQVDAERAAHAGDDASFYRVSCAYLYDLTAFAMTGTKLPYLDALTQAVSSPARFLDWGCGIGSDGLALMAAGYDVAFADFANPSTAYLEWRLQRRDLAAPVFDLDRDEVPGGFDVAYAFDVLEHVEDPWATLAAMETRARLVAVNVLEPDERDTPLHRPLPVDALVAHAERSGTVAHQFLHGRSHLLLYRSPA